VTSEQSAPRVSSTTTNHLRSRFISNFLGKITLEGYGSSMEPAPVFLQMAHELGMDVDKIVR
jgi:hypothetical protein